MSAKDVQLIELIGLRVPEVADLVGRTRQAVYEGIKKPGDYFSSSHLLAMMQDAKRRDAPELSRLIAFIDEAYGNQKATIDKDLILQTRVGIRQLAKACSKANQIIFLINNNSQHLSAGSAFIVALSETVQKYRSITSVVAANNGVFETLGTLGILIPSGQQRTHLQSIADIPAAIINYRTYRRAFGFLRTAVEEFDVEDADSIWQLATASYTVIGQRMPQS